MTTATRAHLLWVILCFITVSHLACTKLIPNYISNPTASIHLARTPLHSVRLGEFNSRHKRVESFNFRGELLAPPHGNSYAIYIKEALKQELEWANALDNNSNITISGTLNKNIIQASGIKTYKITLEATITMKHNNTIIYNKTQDIIHAWNFDIDKQLASKNLANNYPIATQKLLDAFFSDSEFTLALQRHYSP